MKQGRWVGIDYGRVRIGLAASDPRGVIASPLPTVTLKNRTPEVAAEAVWKQVALTPGLLGFVVGLPLLPSGKESEMSQEVRLFARRLQELSNLPLHLQDERLSSAQIERMLRDEAGLRRKERAAHSDPLAATLLLQTFLDSQIK